MSREVPRGFTLIETVIVVALVAILLLVALPAYRGHLAHAARRDAQAMLVAFAQAMERRYARAYSYLGAAEGGADTGPPAAQVFWSLAPAEGAPLYRLSIAVAAREPPYYRLRATPVAGSRQAGDGILELDALGARGWDRDDDGLIGPDEWRWTR